MFSTITIELSTTRPTLSISPIMVMMFIVQPIKYKTVTVIRSDRGIARLIMKAILNLLRKKNKMKNANKPPHIPAFTRFPMDSVMKAP